MYNRHFNTIIPQEKDGARLDHTLCELLPSYSRAYLQKQIQEGSVTVDGKRAHKKSLRVYTNQSIVIMLTEKVDTQSWVGEKNLPLTIVYEDDALCVINKPFGMVTHPAPGNLTGTLANALLHHRPELQQLPRAGIIHRLDKDTSGLLVVPKTILAHTFLTRQIATREIKRFYYAIVKGALKTSGTVDLPMGRHPTHRQKQAVVSNGKPALTRYRITERFAGYTFLSIQLETGRTHQIRVHMAHLKHPILGDQTYGSLTTYEKDLCQRHALHAFRLELEHPTTLKRLVFEAPLPEDMQHILETLQASSHQ